MYYLFTVPWCSKYWISLILRAGHNYLEKYLITIIIIKNVIHSQIWTGRGSAAPILSMEQERERWSIWEERCPPLYVYIYILSSISVHNVNRTEDDKYLIFPGDICLCSLLTSLNPKGRSDVAWQDELTIDPDRGTKYAYDKRLSAMYGRLLDL